MREWEGDFGVVELLHVVALAQLGRHGGSFDDGKGRGADTVPAGHLLVHLRTTQPDTSGAVTNSCDKQ